MGTFGTMLAMANADLNYHQKLYRLTKDKMYRREPFHKEDLGERMSCICEGYSEFVLTRYLINHQLKEAYEAVYHGLPFVCAGDIAPEVKDKTLGIHPSITINRYVNGMALFEWNTVGDDRTWVDEDGHGMRSDNPKFLYGVINQRLEVIGRFRYIDDENQVEKYRRNPTQFMIDFPTS